MTPPTTDRETPRPAGEIPAERAYSLWTQLSGKGNPVEAMAAVLRDYNARPAPPVAAQDGARHERLDTTDYRYAPSGVGPLAAEWKDKPHRLVYDLCKEIERISGARSAGPLPVDFAQLESDVAKIFASSLASGEERKSAWDRIKRLASPASPPPQRGTLTPKQMAERILDQIANSDPDDDTDAAQELLKGTEQEHLFCLSGERLMSHIEVALENMVYDHEHFGTPALRVASPPVAAGVPTREELDDALNTLTDEVMEYGRKPRSRDAWRAAGKRVQDIINAIYAALVALTQRSEDYERFQRSTESELAKRDAFLLELQDRLTQGASKDVPRADATGSEDTARLDWLADNHMVWPSLDDARQNFGWRVKGAGDLKGRGIFAATLRDAIDAARRADEGRDPSVSAPPPSEEGTQ